MLLKFFLNYENYLILSLTSSTLFNAFIISFFGRYLGKRGISFMVYFIYIINLSLAVFVFYVIIVNNLVIETNLYTLFKLQKLKIEIGFLFDTLTAVMCVVVFIISGLVHIYSLSYMEDDPHFNRFIFNLSLFTFFMVVVITANNFIQLFFG